MKRVLFLLTIVLVTGIAQAQPKQRRTQPKTEQQQKKSPSSAMSIRAQISFPTAVDMPEDVVWRRDIYREIDLTKDANAGLYYPVQPEGKQMNLFTYIFKLAQNNILSLSNAIFNVCCTTFHFVLQECIHGDIATLTVISFHGHLVNLLFLK